MTAPPARAKLTASSPLVIAALLGITAVAAWWAYTHEIDAFIALRGFSPIAWVYQMANPGNFVLDFPSGIQNYRLSAFMHVYPAAFRLGIAPEALLPVLVGFEIVLLSIALFTLCRTLLPDGSRKRAKLPACLACRSQRSSGRCSITSIRRAIGRCLSPTGGKRGAPESARWSGSRSD